MTDARGTTTLAERPDPAAEPAPGPGGWRLRLVIALAVVATVVVLAVVTLGGGSPPEAPAVGALRAAPAPAPVAAPQAAPAPTAAAPVASSSPVRVRVPAIGADSSLVPVGLDARRRVEVPSEPMQAAWYSRSPTPGAVGPAVVLGHVNGGGRDGVFADLAQVRPGQEVEVDREDGRTAVFSVYRVTTVPKSAFPTTEVYGNTPDAQIRLVTCGGALDESQHSYLSNVIVFGTLTAIRPA